MNACFKHNEVKSEMQYLWFNKLEKWVVDVNFQETVQ